MQFHSGRKYTLTESIDKIKRYCALQERSHRQVREKLKQWGCYPDQVEAIVTELIGQNFLSETRFAEAIVSGKHKIKGWGRKKIHRWLVKEGVSPYNISKNMQELDEEEYTTKCRDIAVKKWNSLTRGNTYEKKQKTIRYLLQKGYEMDTISLALESISE